MRCAESRELMLEADPAELRGEGTSALALHLASCDDCRAAAEHVLVMTRQLGAALDTRPVRQVRPARVLPWGLAAAAVLALFAVMRSGPVRTTDGTAPVSSVPAVDIEVSSGKGRGAAVFKTGDPNITVVWFF